MACANTLMQKFSIHQKVEAANLRNEFAACVPLKNLACAMRWPTKNVTESGVVPVSVSADEWPKLDRDEKPEPGETRFLAPLTEPICAGRWV